MRAAAFRDEARDIIRQDRDDRRDGRSVDTAGVVARALERAYRLGFEEAQGEPGRGSRASTSNAGTWELVPRRPRSVVLWHVCLVLLGDGTRPEVEGRLFPARISAGGSGWRLAAAVDGPALGIGRTFAERDVAVLRRLGLLAAGEGRLGGLALTTLGRTTWRTAVEAAGRYPDP